MRGNDVQQQAMFSYLSPGARVPQDHPLRPIRDMVNQALRELSGEFQAMYSREGRPSIPPEKLLRALLLQILYTIRSARLLMEQLDYNLLFRWFVGLSMDDKVWDHSVFSKNQERFLDSDLAAAFFGRILKQAAAAGLLSDEHFSVDGTLIEAWASLKSFRPKDAPPPSGGGGRNPEVDFHGEKRLNRTHASTTDPEARLFKKSKGKEAKLCFMGHVLMENRNGLVVSPRLTPATGTAEREAAEDMVGDLPGRHRITVGGDKAYDTQEFVQSLRALKATPHVAQNLNGRKSAIYGRTTRYPGYAVSQRLRKRVEEIFGWMKTVGNLRKARHRGQDRVGFVFTLTAAAYNLVRMRNLTMAASS
ncbi:MAG: IS5 family transposase [Deltaproteobacteria bacterium]|nr:IS5 family transposase [Desulfitobacteriaceae bacterium]MDI6855078.1 IS5 family transposase [Deltaproteobacteria bacterium]